MIRRRTRTLGLALSHDAVRAVVIECRRIMWANETPIDEDQLAAGETLLRRLIDWAEKN